MIDRGLFIVQDRPQIDLDQIGELGGIELGPKKRKKVQETRYFRTAQERGEYKLI